jgi:hypothetical protein
MLSEAGLHTFRFDYYGTGDSSGESWEGSISRWRMDILQALQELKGISGARDLSIVGFRLGAALAAETRFDGFGLKDLVLWDPVVSGRKYIEELKALHLDQVEVFKEIQQSEEFTELLGYRFSRQLWAEIENINLVFKERFEAQNTVVIVSSATREYDELRNHLAAARMGYSFHIVEEANELTNFESVDEAMLVNEILLKIREVMAGKH